MWRATSDATDLKCLQWVSDKLCGASFGGSRNTLHIAFCPSVAAVSTVPDFFKKQINAGVWCAPLGAFVRHACALFVGRACPDNCQSTRSGKQAPRRGIPNFNQWLESCRSCSWQGLKADIFVPLPCPGGNGGTHSHARLSTPNCDSKPCCRVLSNFGRSPWAFNCVCLPARDHMPQASGARWPQQR
jgi:hypothetical protein